MYSYIGSTLHNCIRLLNSFCYSSKIKAIIYRNLYSSTSLNTSSHPTYHMLEVAQQLLLVLHDEANHLHKVVLLRLLHHHLPPVWSCMG